MFSKYTFVFILENVNIQGVLDINQVKKKIFDLGYNIINILYVLKNL